MSQKLSQELIQPLEELEELLEEIPVETAQEILNKWAKEVKELKRKRVSGNDDEDGGVNNKEGESTTTPSPSQTTTTTTPSQTTNEAPKKGGRGKKKKKIPFSPTIEWFINNFNYDNFVKQFKDTQLELGEVDVEKIIGNMDKEKAVETTLYIQTYLLGKKLKKERIEKGLGMKEVTTKALAVNAIKVELAKKNKTRSDSTLGGWYRFGRFIYKFPIIAIMSLRDFKEDLFIAKKTKDPTELYLKLKEWKDGMDLSEFYELFKM